VLTQAVILNEKLGIPGEDDFLSFRPLTIDPETQKQLDNFAKDFTENIAKFRTTFANADKFQRA